MGCDSEKQAMAHWLTLILNYYPYFLHAGTIFMIICYLHVFLHEAQMFVLMLYICYLLFPVVAGIVSI